MTALKRAADVQRALGRWDPAVRLLLLAGTDASATRALAAAAVAALADPADPLSVTDLPPEELKADPGRLSDEAASISMFGSARVIRVQGATDHATEAVRLLLQAPAAGNPVVMLAGDLSKASSLRKLADESPQVLFHFSYPRDARDLSQWLQSEARSVGLRLEQGVGDRLIATSGGDTGVLASELEKFALFLDASPEAPKALARGHLALLGADSAEEDVNLLVSALTSANARQLERQLRLLAGSGAIPALRAVARRLLQLAEARAAVDGGAAAEQAVRSLRPPIFWKEVEATTAALRDWPQPRIRAALAAMLAGERAIKQEKGPGDAVGWQAIASLGMGRLGMGRESA
ncbi:MAG: DNA polymerase III subunit delta [Sandaracinobacteroides sp.]